MIDIKDQFFGTEIEIDVYKRQEETLRLIAEGKINTGPLITHTYPLSRIEEAYELFENKRNGVIKVAVEC